MTSGPTMTFDAPVAIDRTDELERARQALERGNGIIVTGPPGVGKTHLARRVASSISEAIRPTPTDFTSGADPVAVARAVAAAGANRPDDEATRRPHTIVVDDLHLLDATTSLDVVRACRADRIRLIATAPMIVAPWNRPVRDGVIERVSLGPFDHGDTAELVRTMLDGPVAADVIWWVWQTAAGNPRYAIDLVESAAAEGSLARPSGTWVLIRDPRPESGLVDQVRLELAALGDDARDLIDVVALGGRVPLDLLTAKAGDGTLDDQVRNGLLVVGFDARTDRAVVSVRHRRFGAIAASLVPPVKRLRLFERFVDVAALPDGPSEFLVDATGWALSCAAPVDVDVILAAARAAAAVGRVDATDRLATAALARADETSPTRVEALLLRSEARRSAGRDAAAEVDVDAAHAVLGRADLDDATRRRRSFDIAVARANLAQFGRGDCETALTIIDAERTARDPSSHPDDAADAAELWLRAEHSMRLAYDSRFADAAAEPLSDADVARLPGPLRVEYAMGTIFTRALRGDLPGAITAATRLTGFTAAIGADAPWGSLQAQSLAFALLLWTGEVDTAAALMESADTDRDAPGFVDPAVRQVGRGLLALAQRDWDRAVAEFTAATARFRLVDFSGWMAMCLTWLATAHAANGNTVEAATVFAEARATPLRASGILAFDLLDNWCRVAITLGSSEAPELAAALIADGHRQDLPLVELWGWHTLAMTGVTVEDPELLDGFDGDVGQRIGELAARIDGALPRARADHARALLDGEQPRIATTFETLGRLGYWVPVHPLGAASALTPRQLRVARLAATGLASADIAARLFISKRTVDAHLAHIYERLGVHRRHDLAAILSTVPDHSADGSP